ncbi:MAG: archease [Deltaproteobacteria bacterium]|nr:archease [Deltaproteobacteria bacterium]
MDSDKQDFIVLNHTADSGIMVCGTDIRNLFEKAAIAIMQIMVSSRHTEKTRTIKLSLDEQDLPGLMVRWLGEILYLFAGEKEVVTGIRIDSISPSHLDATLESVPFDPDLHEILCEIKAVTYHQIQVVEKDDCWEARVIFDL